MNNPTESRFSADIKVVFEACTPQFYSSNPFRVTGLAMNASNKTVKKTIDEMKASIEFGENLGQHFAFALQPPPDLEQIKKAAFVLNDPHKRCVAEFFWFWPLEWNGGVIDEFISPLQLGDTSAALLLWEKGTKSRNPTKKAVAIHNLAVYYHLAALDGELELLSRNNSANVSEAEPLWNQVINFWDKVPDSEALWSHFAERIRLTDDPRLTTGFARRLRNSLPDVLDHINGRCAVEFANRGKYADAKRHIQYARLSNQGSDNLDATVEEITKPIKFRIDKVLEAASQSSASDPGNGDKLAMELLKWTEEPRGILQTLNSALEKYDFEYFEYNDRIASTCLHHIIDFGNATSNWKRCVDALGKIVHIPVSEKLHQIIIANIEQAEENYTIEKNLKQLMAGRPSATQPSSSQSGCFIATAVYGSPLAKEVLFLSQFRDVILASSALGRKVIQIYYIVSPSIAARIVGCKTVRRIVRCALIMPLLWIVKLQMRYRTNSSNTP